MVKKMGFLLLIGLCACFFVMAAGGGGAVNAQDSTADELTSVEDLEQEIINARQSQVISEVDLDDDTSDSFENQDMEDPAFEDEQSSDVNIEEEIVVQEDNIVQAEDETLDQQPESDLPVEVVVEAPSQISEIPADPSEAECLTCDLSDKSATKPELERVSEASKRFANLKGSGERMTIDFKESEMSKVFRLFSEWANTNIILDPELKDVMVTLHLKDVTLPEAMDIVFNSYGLKHAEIGDSIFVASADKINSMDAVTKTIRLRNVNAGNVEKLLKDVIKTSVADEELGTIVITGSPSQVAEAEALIKETDRPQKQVLLTTQVLEIKLTSGEQTGIDWSGSTSFAFQETDRPGVITGLGTVASAPQPFQIYRLARNALKFNMTINHLIESGKAKVLANPKISTVVGKEAHIFIGDVVPYEVTTISGGATSTEVRFTEAGVKLSLTPSIIEDDYVVVTVAPEVSSITGWRGENDQYPEVSTREAEASMRINNNETFVLGGLLSEEETLTNGKVPFLGDIPLMGALFRSKTKEFVRKEIIITVTPQIINN